MFANDPVPPPHDGGGALEIASEKRSGADTNCLGILLAFPDSSLGSCSGAGSSCTRTGVHAGRMDEASGG